MNEHFAQSIRDSAERALPEGAFLRRDRGNALYITDAPRRSPDGAWMKAIDEAGFTCEVTNGLARITLKANWLEALEEMFPEPPDHLSATLVRFRAQTPDETVLTLFAHGIKTLESGGDMWDFNRVLRQHAAVCLRDPAHTGGGLYACALIRYLMVKERIS